MKVTFRTAKYQRFDKQPLERRMTKSCQLLKTTTRKNETTDQNSFYKENLLVSSSRSVQCQRCDDTSSEGRLADERIVAFFGKYTTFIERG